MRSSSGNKPAVAQETGGRAGPGDRRDEGAGLKKTVTGEGKASPAAQRREAARFRVGRKISERRAVELAGIGRSSLHYKARGRRDDLKLLDRHPR